MLSATTHDVISALLSAWPAGAFIGSVEMAMGLVRAIRAVEAGDAGSETEDDSDSDTDRDNDDARDGGGGDKDSDTNSPPNRRRKATADPVKTAIKKGWEDDKIIARLGVTKRTIQRHRRDLKAEAEATGNATS
jgi:DNA-binding NarL/FixJ family response regulator